MKATFCLLSLLVLSTLWASDEVPLKGQKESTFAIKEQGSYSGIYTLKVKDQDVFVNGVKLPQKEVEKNLKEIASLLENNGKEQTCSGNEFIHQVKNADGLKRERGCLNQGRFSELQKSFQKLERLTW